MPLPLVKSFFPASGIAQQPAPSPVASSPATKASAAKASASKQSHAEAETGGTFREELLRRRRAEAPPKAESVRRSEPKRPPRTRKPARPSPDEAAKSDGESTVFAPSQAPGGAESDAGAADRTDASDTNDEAPRDVSSPADADHPADATAHADAAAAGVTGSHLADPARTTAASDVRPGVTATGPDVPDDAAGAVQGSPTGDERPGPAVYHAADGVAPAHEPVDSAGAPGAVDGGAAHAAKTVGAVSPLFPDERAKGGGESPPSHDGGNAASNAAPALPAADVAAAAADAVAQFQLPPAASARPAHVDADADTVAATATAGFSDAAMGAAGPSATHAPAAVADATPPEVRFASANHENIVTSMRADLLPNGGSMHIRLDPPQLGALQVTVQIRDGQITASFETSSDEATRLLGHSLNQLKSALETQGVAVDKLQVQQAPRDAKFSGADDDGQRERGTGSQEQEQSARQEQQRREMLRKMWRRLAGGQDPLDLTA